jgi:hypothetical protein
MNKLITYTRIAEEQYINLLKRLISAGKSDLDVVSLLQARLNDEEVRNALNIARINQGISLGTDKEIELEVCRTLIAYYQEVKAILNLQGPVAGQSILDYKREFLNLPTAAKSIEDLIKKQALCAAASQCRWNRCNCCDSFNGNRLQDSCNSFNFHCLSQDHPYKERPYKERLDKYDQALREAIIRDGVPIRSLTDWELRRLQLIWDIDNRHIIPPEALRSSLKIDYIPLWRLLEANQWQEANHATQQLMLEIARRNRFQHWIAEAVPCPGSIGLADLQNFPCVDLLTIDHLWLRFSNGHFGFSVQDQIWRWLNANLNEFAQQVGWLSSAGWIASHYLQAPPMSKRGHLPFILPIFQPAYQNWETCTAAYLRELLQRLETCPIRVA